MGSEDELYFSEAMREGLFPENIELLDKAFVIDWKEADIEDPYVLKRAQPDQLRKNAIEPR
jgi:hypothetical protein